MKAVVFFLAVSAAGALGDHCNSFTVTGDGQGCKDASDCEWNGGPRTCVPKAPTQECESDEAKECVRRCEPCACGLDDSCTESDSSTDGEDCRECASCEEWGSCMPSDGKGPGDGDDGDGTANCATQTQKKPCNKKDGCRWDGQVCIVEDDDDTEPPPPNCAAQTQKKCMKKDGCKWDGQVCMVEDDDDDDATEPCDDSCQNPNKGWPKKCGWERCQGCTECGTVEEPEPQPTPAPPPCSSHGAQKSCKKKDANGLKRCQWIDGVCRPKIE